MTLLAAHTGPCQLQCSTLRRIGRTAPAVRPPRHTRRGRQHCVTLRAVPDALWEYDFDKNPQNTQNPVVMPSPSLSPQQAVEVQLAAISRNDHPWDNHGVQTMYEFAEDCGSMERSRYFGFSKDLYHLDHFLGAFKTTCGPLVDCQSYTLLQGPPEGLQQQPQGNVGSVGSPQEGVVAVYVAVKDSKGGDGGMFELRLVQRQAGLKKGCWMTKSCIRVQ